MAARRRIKIPELNTAINEILEEYGTNVTEKTKAAVLKVAKIAAQETKAGSPYRTGNHKHYASGWTVKKEDVDRLRTDAIVHNRSRYQLAHLLEKGHALRGGGRAQAIVHIKPAEENAIRNLEEAMKRIAKG